MTTFYGEQHRRLQDHGMFLSMGNIAGNGPFLPTRFQGLAEAEHVLITADEYGQRLLRGDG